MKIKLTELGFKKVEFFISECKAKRKEVLDAKLDSANETVFPTIEDIVSDIKYFIDEDGEYCNFWGVTDNYNSDNPLCLVLGEDFIYEKA